MSKNQSNQSLTKITTSKEDANSVAALIRAKAAEHGLVAHDFYTMKPGDVIDGVYMGPAGSIEFENKQTGELKDVQTHSIKLDDGTMLRVLGSTVLDRDLPNLVNIGDRVILAHNGQRELGGGRRANDVKIFAKPKAIQVAEAPAAV